MWYYSSLVISHTSYDTDSSKHLLLATTRSLLSNYCCSLKSTLLHNISSPYNNRNIDMRALPLLPTAITVDNATRGNSNNMINISQVCRNASYWMITIHSVHDFQYTENIRSIGIYQIIFQHRILKLGSQLCELIVQG